METSVDLDGHRALLKALMSQPWLGQTGPMLAFAGPDRCAALGRPPRSATEQEMTWLTITPNRTPTKPLNLTCTDRTPEPGAAGTEPAPDAGQGTENDTASPDDDAEDDVNDEGGDERPRMHERLTLSPRNAAVIGQVTLHYAARDVVVYLDGDAAMRLLTMYRNRREGIYGDQLDPYDTDARNAFVVLDLDDPPLTVSWLPGVPTRRPRTAIDPTVGTD